MTLKIVKSNAICAKAPFGVMDETLFQGLGDLSNSAEGHQGLQ